jgi:hypothetical protein
MKKYVITLSNDERNGLNRLVSTGEHGSQKILNALILLACDEGEFQTQRSTSKEIAHFLNVSTRKIDRLKNRFVTGGIGAALERKKPDRTYARKVDGDVEAHLIALSCSEPPEGHARWSLRLLADRAVELEYVDSISYETVRRALKKTRSSRGKGRSG